MKRGSPELSRRGVLFAIAAAALVVAGILAAPASASTPGTYEFSGEVAGCEYLIGLDSGAQQIDLETKNCEEGALTMTAEAEYVGGAITLDYVTATGTIDGKSVNLAESMANSTFTIGFDIESLAEEVVEGADQSTLEPAIEAYAGAASDRIAAAAFERVVGGVFSENRVVRQVEGTEEELCDAYSNETVNHTNDNCYPSACPEGCEKVTPIFAEVGSPGPGIEGESSHLGLARTAAAGDKESAGNKTSREREEENEELCPAVNNAQKKFIFACLPTVIRGNVETGSKPLVLLPGAVLIFLPLGGTSVLDLSTTPTISSTASVISLGGVVAGYNGKVKAPTVALSAGVVDMAHDLTIEGEHVDLGSVDIHDLLGGTPPEVAGSSDLGQWINFATSVVALNLPAEGIFDESIFSAPTLVGGAQVTADPKVDFTLGPTSRITASGRGGGGGEGANDIGGKPEGEAAGGAKDEYGGSHGGYGGYVGSTTTTSENWGIWQEKQGRGPTFGNPFAPTEPGSGGSGGDDVARGANGGGVIRIDAPKASVRVEGRIDADGNGLDHRFSDEDTGGAGAGAGGSVYVSTKSLLGGGEISADGGGYCVECINGFGGMGGGGRVALVYGADDEWHGTAHAHGGVDQQYTGFEDYYFAGTGGAGTVFTRQAKFDSHGNVESGLGAFPSGTLTIDGGRPVGTYPPPDGTPIDLTWSSQQRKLVLTGEARAYAGALSFGEIDVLGGSDLTTEFSLRKLDVTAGALNVDADSRIDMTGRGYAGGSPGYDDSEPEGGAAEAAPGQTPAVRDYGGSHGGAGGAPSGYLHPESGDRPSSTYDDPQNPALPGGGGAGNSDSATGNPGGGVLDVNAGTLQLDGLLAADGEDNNGPNEDDPTPFSLVGGAGAGGSVLVHAEALSGSGVVRADGGWACLTGEGPPLLPEGNTCNYGGGSSAGAGGGGRVAVYAHRCGWAGELRAAGGISQNAIGSDNAEQTTGGPGSTYFSELDSTCPSESGEASPSESPRPPESTPSQPRRRAPKLWRLKLRGRMLSLRISEPGLVEVRLARCGVKRRRHHRRRRVARRCALARRFTVRAKRAGGLRIPLPRNLRPGRYRLRVSAIDLAGNRARVLNRTVVLRKHRG